jgi:hypothetical protein
MYQTNPPQRDILQFAIDARRDKIAKYLLTMGMAWDVKVKIARLYLIFTALLRFYFCFVLLLQYGNINNQL